MAFKDLHIQILEDFVELNHWRPYRRIGSLAQFHASKGFQPLTTNGVWRTTDPAEEPINPWDWRRNNSRGTLVRRKLRPYGRRMNKTREILADLNKQRATERAMRAGMVPACEQ